MSKEEITKDIGAHMKHKLYHEKIVQHHHVMLMGWPQNILFKNLGECSSSLQELQSLLEKLLNGQMYWKTITEDELNELEDEHKKQIEDGKITPPAPHLLMAVGDSERAWDHLRLGGCEVGGTYRWG